MTKSIKVFLPVIFTALIITLFHFTHWIMVKYYPAVMNFFIFLMFFTSSFQKETVIQRFARMMEPDIKPKALEYTRKLTYIWAGFTFLNFIVSFLSVFMSENFWMWYNGCISYALIGIFFAVEYVVRINFKRKYDC